MTTGSTRAIRTTTPRYVWRAGAIAPPLPSRPTRAPIVTHLHPPPSLPPSLLSPSRVLYKTSGAVPQQSFVPFTGGQASFGSKDASKRDEFSDLKRLAKHREFLRTLERLDANDDPEEMARSRREFAEEERVFAEERPLIYDLINGPPITAKERAAADRAKKAAGPAKSPNHMWATSTQSYGSGSDAPRGDAPRVNFGRVSTTKEFATQGHL